jgi:hypothetical protein
MSFSGFTRKSLANALIVAAALCGGAATAIFGVCGPFSDVTDAGFCPFVLEVFYLGITTGTTPTTYDPASSVSRLQMAAFLSRSVDGVLKRGHRAAVNQFWTTQGGNSLGLTTISGAGCFDVRYDGADVWVSNGDNFNVSRVRASDGRLLETWTGAASPNGLLVAMGRVFIAGGTSPGNLYQIIPSQPAGAVTAVTGLGNQPVGIAFDGSRIWTANIGTSVSIVTPGTTIPWDATSVSAGFSQPFGILYDGTNIWITDYNFGTLLKLNSAGAILQTVTVGAHPRFPVFDGGNIWVPNAMDSSVSVVRASTGAVLATLTGNGLNNPFAAAFDGQRILVTNQSGNSVSLWKAADLTAIGTFPTGGPGTAPRGVCSDGTNFWIALLDKLARF